MTDPGDPDGPARLARLADGYLATQLLYAAVALGLPEALAAGPRGADDLARELGAVPGLLHRVLRGLAAEEVIDERADGRFALTELGALLTPGAPGSLRGTVSARGEVYYQATAGLVDALRGGGTPYEIVHGLPFFAHLATDPPRRAAFQASMASRSAREAAAVDDPAAVRMDLHMLVLLRGRERTVAEFTALFDAAGLRLAADIPTPAGVHVLEARPR